MSAISTWIRYIQVIFVVDHSTYLQFNNIQKVYRRCLAIANYANTILEALKIKLVVSDVEIWKDGNPIHVGGDYRKLIRDFVPIREELLMAGKSHDHSVLLSGVNFIGDTVGYAFEGVMCKRKSVSLVQHYPKGVSMAVVAGTMVHEIGHSLGCKHDADHCHANSSREPFIMHPAGVEGNKWSHCSKIYLAKHIDNFPCLRDKPRTKDEFASCGNGILDPGEQCDCGANKLCRKCCNVSNCTLKSDALCGTGSCCNFTSCKPLAIATKCRDGDSECDLPEYCSGAFEFCPKNYYKHDGAVCRGGNGRCHRGRCKSRDSLCQLFLNPAARAMQSSAAAHKKDTKHNSCTMVACHSHLLGNETYQWNEATYIFVTTSTTFYILFRSIADLFDNFNGIPCGINKTCQNDLCIDIPRLEFPDCADNCGGHGVCNNGGYCHCEANFAPPDCERGGMGGSLVSGLPLLSKDYDHSGNFMLIFFMLFPIIIFVCCCWSEISNKWQERKLDQQSKFNLFEGCLEKCFCPCMEFCTRWTEIMWRQTRIKKDFEPVATEILNDPGDLRKTICEVQVDVNHPENQVKSWGVASETLVTDIITVTPQSTPDMQRKIRVSSKSKSEEKLNRPNYSHSLSKDSGYPSETDDESQFSYKGSMGSLIARFKSFGRQKSTQEDAEEDPQIKPPHMLAKSGTLPRDTNLRRMVVDPMAKRSLSKQKSNPLENTRPEYRRSFSCDSDRELCLKKQPLILPPKSRKPLNLSERNLHLPAQTSAEPPSRLPMQKGIMLPPKIPISRDLQKGSFNSERNSKDSPPPKPKSHNGPDFSVKRPILPPNIQNASHNLVHKKQVNPSLQAPFVNQTNHKLNISEMVKKFEA